MAQEGKLREAVNSGEGAKKSTHSGPKLKYAHVEKPLLDWCREMRSRGLRLSLERIAVRAQQLDPEIAKLSATQAHGFAQRFCMRNRLVSRKKTKTSQKRESELSPKAVEFEKFVRSELRLFSTPLGHIINMDQTPVYFDSMHAHTLDFEGAREVSYILH